MSSNWKCRNNKLFSKSSKCWAYSASYCVQNKICLKVFTCFQILKCFRVPIWFFQVCYCAKISFLKHYSLVSTAHKFPVALWDSWLVTLKEVKSEKAGQAIRWQQYVHFKLKTVYKSILFHPLHGFILFCRIYKSFFVLNEYLEYFYPLFKLENCL